MKSHLLSIIIAAFACGAQAAEENAPPPFKFGKVGNGVNFVIPPHTPIISVEIKMANPGRGCELAVALTDLLKGSKLLGVNSHAVWDATPSTGGRVDLPGREETAVLRVSASVKTGGYDGKQPWAVADVLPLSVDEKTHTMVIGIDDSAVATPQWTRAFAVIRW